MSPYRTSFFSSFSVLLWFRPERPKQILPQNIFILKYLLLFPNIIIFEGIPYVVVENVALTIIAFPLNF